VILAGDVGGTKTLLGLFTRAEGELRSLREASYPSQDAPSLEAIVGEFLAGHDERLRALAVGVAGPVVGQRSQVVNLRWPVDATKLAAATGIPRVRLLNDLEATAWGIPELRGRQLESLTPGLGPGEGHGAVIAAGTGLGMALLFRDGERVHPSPSEGGHQTFAPRDDLEIDLLRFLRGRHGRVSVERVVSGPGMLAIYQFLVDTGRGRESAEMTRRLAAAADKNAVVGQAGLSGEDPTAERAVELWLSLYGAAA
jgi:glucokinase